MCYSFLTVTRSIGCTCTNRSFGKASNPILHAVSPVSQNLCVESLNQFYIFLARKYASFGHSAFFRNPFGKLSHLRAKYGKSPQKICRFSLCGNTKFSPNVLIWSKYFSIMETTGWYLSIDMWFVLVHCCVGMLMTSCFWGATPIFGTQKNYATTTWAAQWATQWQLSGHWYKGAGNVIPRPIGYSAKHKRHNNYIHLILLQVKEIGWLWRGSNVQFTFSS